MTEPAPPPPLRHRLVAAGLRAVTASRADRWLAPLARGEGVILTFHRVRPWSGGAYAPNRFLEITPDFLDAAVRAVHESGFEIIPLDAVPARLRRLPGAPPFAVLTFDDGYRDNLEHAWPVLRRHRVPWTVYVVPGLAEGTGRLWWLELEEAVARLDRLILSLDGREIVVPARCPAEKRSAYATLLRLLRRGGHHGLRRTVSSLYEQVGGNPGALVRRHCAGWDEIEALAADPNVTIGSHTLTHPVLAKVSAFEAEAEIGASRTLIAERLGRPVRHLAYPSGGADAAGPREFAMAERAGYVTAVTTRPGHLFPRDAARPMALPRVSVNGHHQNAGALRGLLSGVPFLGGAVLGRTLPGAAAPGAPATGRAA